MISSLRSRERPAVAAGICGCEAGPVDLARVDEDRPASAGGRTLVTGVDRWDLLNNAAILVGIELLGRLLRVETLPVGCAWRPDDLRVDFADFRAMVFSGYDYSISIGQCCISDTGSI
jgi:hypothetical protein